MKKLEFKVRGMHCRSCERIIEKQANSVDGVVKIKADYAKGMVEVTYDPAKTSIEEILDKISEKGYECSLSGTPKKSGGIAAALGVAALLVGAYLLIGRFDSSIPNLDQNTSLLLKRNSLAS
jgi:copper chaperone CopZ